MDGYITFTERRSFVNANCEHLVLHIMVTVSEKFNKQQTTAFHHSLYEAANKAMSGKYHELYSYTRLAKTAALRAGRGAFAITNSIVTIKATVMGEQDGGEFTLQMEDVYLAKGEEDGTDTVNSDHSN